MPSLIEDDAVLGAELRSAGGEASKPSLDGTAREPSVHSAQGGAKASLSAPVYEHQVVDMGADDEILPSEQDLKTLRRVADRIPFKVYTIAFVELCERFSYYGSVVVVDTNFIQQRLPEGSQTGAGGPGAEAVSGALGLGQRASTGITTLNSFWQYVMPLFGAYIADRFWGRYKTIVVALSVGIIGHVILTMSAIPPVLTKPPGHPLAVMIIAILVIGLGTGGFKPNISPLIVEQLPLKQMTVRTSKTGERVIVDPTVTINRVYNWFYLFINAGALVGQVSMVYAEKFVGFYLAFLLPTCMLCICPAVMWWGRNTYDRRPPTGAVLGKAMKTWALAQRGRWSVLPWVTWRRMNDGTFWENVKPSRFAPGTKPEWMTFDDAWVDELARGFSACKVFMWYPIYWLTYNQMNNNLVSQAAVMQLGGFPNDVISNLDPIALIILIPLCDVGIYPLLRRLHVRFTPIRRITAGFAAGAAAMAWAAAVQAHVYRLSACGDRAAGYLADGLTPCPHVRLSVWAQSGAYVLIALSEVFASVTALEYAFSKAPRNMRSTVQAVALFTSATASAVGQGFVALSADPLLVWNYASMSVLAAVAGALFWFQFRALDADEDTLNELPEGTLHVAGALPAAEEESRVQEWGVRRPAAEKG